MLFTCVGQIFRQEEPTKPANAAPNLPDVNVNVAAPDSSPNSALARPNKVNTENKDSSPVEQAAASKMDKAAVAQKEGQATVRSSPGPVKRKATSIGPKIKRFRMDSEESMELKITWEEAQELLRPPLKAPSVVIVDGHEFEEYEVCHASQISLAVLCMSQKINLWCCDKYYTCLFRYFIFVAHSLPVNLFCCMIYFLVCTQYEMSKTHMFFYTDILLFSGATSTWEEDTFCD